MDGLALAALPPHPTGAGLMLGTKEKPGGKDEKPRTALPASTVAEGNVPA